MDVVMEGRGPLIRASLKIALLFMTLTVVFFASVAYFSGAAVSAPPSKGFGGQSAPVDIISGLTSFLVMSIAVWSLRRESMFFNILLCFVAAYTVSLADFLTTRELYRYLYPDRGIDFSIATNINDLFMCWAMFFGWSCLFLTLLYSFDVQDRERRLAAVREEALSAQMRALRYQVNPHFLFNTLNSIAGLIEEGSATRAERMVLSLSTFLRTTLTLDPFQDVPLSEELALQEEYLEIEHERFSDRLSFRIDMPDDASEALVPSLILQPLIENAIKHGVGATTAKVSISLSARRSADRLHLTIENEMPMEAGRPKPAGTGVGLKNVAERLRARFQDEGHLVAGPAAPDLYRVMLDMPWRTV